MTTLIWEILTPGVLITLAGGLFTLGYLIINQMLLRIMILAGSLAYIAYYWTAADAPLWGAIYTTLIMMGANLIGMAKLLLRNAKFSVPREFADIYPHFAPLMPGDFRALMRLCARRSLPEETVLTREGVPQNSVYYVVSGIPTVTKLGTTFPLAEHIFVGEVAYLTGRGASATTVLPPGSEILEWDLGTLRAAIKRRPQVKLALDAVISQDLAKKVALAVAPAARQMAQDQADQN